MTISNKLIRLKVYDAKSVPGPTNVIKENLTEMNQ